MTPHEKLLISAENENLITGDTKVFCDILDNHIAHIDSHKELLTNPENRVNPQITQRIIDHIQEHINSQLEYDKLWAGTGSGR